MSVPFDEPEHDDGGGRVEEQFSFTVLGLFGHLDKNLDDPNEKPCMERYRIQTTDPTSEGFEIVHVQPGKGLMYKKEDGSSEPHPFWHIEEEKRDRDVLFQSIENYDSIFRSEEFREYYRKVWEEETSEEDLELDESALILKRALDWPQFGEQVIVRGVKPQDISIGDVFEAEGSTLRFQVTSPRKPCSELDDKNEVPYGAKGIRVYTASKGLAGWFTRVLVAGEISDGMTFVRVSHPHPKWTLANISKAVYGGEAKLIHLKMVRAGWGRSDADLQELLNMDSLADFEWKDELRKIDQKRQEEEAKEEEETTEDWSYMGLPAACACWLLPSLFSDAPTFNVGRFLPSYLVSTDCLKNVDC